MARADRETRAGDWPRLFGADVHGKTLGIVGLGSIGKEVARRASGFAMRVIAHDPYPDQAFADRERIEFRALDELLAAADRQQVRVERVEATAASEVARYAELSLTGRYAAAYLSLGLVDQ